MKIEPGTFYISTMGCAKNLVDAGVMLGCLEDDGFAVGDRVRVLMNHVCTAVNMQERIYGVRGEEVVETWVVEGRGKLQ